LEQRRGIVMTATPASIDNKGKKIKFIGTKEI
jgi:hypothetical protein